MVESTCTRVCGGMTHACAPPCKAWLKELNGLELCGLVETVEHGLHKPLWLIYLSNSQNMALKTEPSAACVVTCWAKPCSHELYVFGKRAERFLKRVSKTIHKHRKKLLTCIPDMMKGLWKQESSAGRGSLLSLDHQSWDKKKKKKKADKKHRFLGRIYDFIMSIFHYIINSFKYWP